MPLLTSLILPLIMSLALLFPGSAPASPTTYPVGVTIHDAEAAYEGCTIYQTWTDTKVNLIDMNGDTVHWWTDMDYTTTFYAQPLDNGDILTLANRKDDPEQIGGVIEMNWAGRVVWEYFDPDGRSAHHDVRRLENGNTLILLNEYTLRPEISPLMLIDDVIVEIDRSGKIVWEWRAADHFDEFNFSDEAKALIEAEGGDWLHANSIQSLPENKYYTAPAEGVDEDADPTIDTRFKPGNILVSFREINTMAIIYKKNGDIVWQAGPNNSITVGQHDAQIIPQGLPGEGNLLVFDNGGYYGYPPAHRSFSRVFELNPLDLQTVWSYDPTKLGQGGWTFDSNIISGQQRLPNGNTLICEGLFGRLFEVTADHRIVWEFVNPDIKYFPGWNVEAGSIYRALRVTQNWVEEARSTAGR